jgi:short subunit dehydrogenase-like uncharacterized protein
MMKSNWMIYGANGYTGALTARMAVARGMRPVLAGRNAAEISALAAELDLDARIFDLTDAPAVDAGIGDMHVVLHCAGPFSRTSQPMVDACMRTGVHYLDITGELSVFEALAARDDAAKQAGVMLMPGAGFDVVPTDCLAAHLHRRLPTATHLMLAFQALSDVSRGTATTVVEQIGAGRAGMIRQQGALVEVPTAWKTREVDFGRGPRLTMSVPWGDVSTAYHTTGIPNIEVYMAMAPQMIRAAKAGRLLAPIMGLGPLQALLKRWIRSRPAGPSDAVRAQGLSRLWGMACDQAGTCVESRMQTPEGYTLTALASLLIVGKVLAGDAPAGYQTPASAYGPNLVMEIEGVTRVDVAT